MAKSLSDIVGLVKKGDDNILEEQEKTNKTLESIDLNMKAFLKNQRNGRLDDLEASREKKRPSGGKGLIGGAALGAGAASAFNMASGDTINPVFAAALTAAALKAVSASGRLVKAALGTFRNGLADVHQRIKIVEADLNKRLKELDKANKARTAELDKIKADAEKARIAAETEKARLDKERAASDNARQKRAIDQKIRISEAAEADRIKAEKQRIADIETARKVADMERHNIERMKDAAAEAKAKKSFAKYKAMLRVEEGKARFDEIERGTAKADRLNSTADRGLMNTADEVTARKLNAMADRGLMNTADEVTGRMQNATADRGLMKTAERQKLINDMGTAKTKRQRNAIIKKALTTMNAEELARLNLKPIMSSGQSGANRVMAATNLVGSKAFLPFDEIEARYSASPDGLSSGTSSTATRITAGADGPTGGAKTTVKGITKGAAGFVGGSALGFIPGMDGFDALKGSGVTRVLGYLGIVLSVLDGIKGGQDATVSKIINENKVITNEEKTIGQSVGVTTAFGNIPAVVKKGWLTYMPRFLGGAKEDTSAEEIYEEAFEKGIAGSIATGGEYLGEKVGLSVNAILGALGRDEKFLSLEQELKDLTKGGVGGDDILTKEQFLKAYISDEAQYWNSENDMEGEGIFSMFSPERKQFRADLDARYNKGVETGDFVSQGFTKEQAAAYKANPDLYFMGGLSGGGIDGTAGNMIDQEHKRRIDAAYPSSKEYKDTVIKGQELQKMYQHFIDTYEARLAESKKGGTVINNNTSVTNSGKTSETTTGGNMTIIDLNSGGAIPGYSQ
jgi:hypothetical protein